MACRSCTLAIAAKGAPEAIADLCHMDAAQQQALAGGVEMMAGAGLRVLGVARAAFQQTALPHEQHDFTFAFLGLIGLADPVRPAVPAVLRECEAAGIRVVMLTGDYPATAQSIAQQIGLTPLDDVLTGGDLAQMNAHTLQQRIRTVNIYARVLPEHKLRLVNALKANGELVAMTGDGVNDAPALKAAHIGVAMGGRGTDVAREAADLVLLDDDFSSLVAAVRLGRRIFDNLTKAMAYLLTIHVPIAGMSLIPVLLKWPLVLLPVHIAFLHLIIDPACSVVFEVEPEEVDVMQRPPRDPRAPLFDRRTLGMGLLQGGGLLLILVAVFGIALYRGQDEHDGRALAFTTLILANLGLIITNRSWARHLPLPCACRTQRYGGSPPAPSSSWGWCSMCRPCRPSSVSPCCTRSTWPCASPPARAACSGAKRSRPCGGQCLADMLTDGGVVEVALTGERAACLL
jgi:P-type Ca2+ transporter type 2C